MVVGDGNEDEVVCVYGGNWEGGGGVPTDTRL